jgi:primosomal protein N'
MQETVVAAVVLPKLEPVAQPRAGKARQVPLDVLYSAVAASPGRNKRQIAELLATSHQRGPKASDLNQQLYAHPTMFRWIQGEGYNRVWFAVPPSAAPDHPAPVTMGDFERSLYPWQQRALAAWIAAGRRGVVEAVTGAGKTRLALAAAQMEIDLGGRVVVIVPTLAPVEQWAKEVEKHLHVRVGQLRVGPIRRPQA